MNFTSPYVDLPQRLTVRQNLRIYGDLYAVARPRERIAELARDLDLDELLDRPFGRLSAGQKTRVLLAKALINEPELLLLDEPTASLDPDTADQLRGHLERYQARTRATVLLASHNMGEVERLAHHVLMLRQGRLVDQGSPDELLARYGRDDLEDVFLDIARDRRRPAPARMTLPPPLRRIRAMLYRHAYLLLGSWPRLLDLVYWPTVQMILWGFITLFLVGQSGWVAKAAGVFLSAVLLWDTLFRGQLGVSLVLPRGAVRAPPRPPVRQPAAPGRAGDRQLPGQPDARPDRRRRCRHPGGADLPLLADRHPRLDHASRSSP